MNSLPSLARRPRRLRSSQRLFEIVEAFDIDAIDPAYAPGAGAHEPGGISSRFALDAVRALAPHCHALAVTEVNPMTDHRDMTSTLAAYLVFTFAVFGATPFASDETSQGT